MMLIGKLCTALLTLAAFAIPAQADISAPRSTAMLGVFFQNDNEAYQPTSDAERARMAAIEAQFKSTLDSTDRYKFVQMKPDVRADIVNGQPLSECGGCEIDFGKRLGADTVAWIRVQKVSNLILNMNVYVADVATQKMLFLHSVDMRNNTDESWTRSMDYLLKNYLLPTLAVPAAG
ncbi:MAG TPA: DUF3280 domain-containing protein [Hyphomicrobium sp.]|nr:DUF3280 domain-containing protein [Hyphomicrobium sp.]